jgi:Peptidase A4 family
VRQLEKSIKHGIPRTAKKTNIPGAFTIARPSKELKVKAAGLRTLLHYGLSVKRPPPGADSKLITLWNETINEILRAQNFVVPQLEPLLGVTHQLKDLKQTDSGYASKNWGGAALVGNWSGVVGQWTIPTVSRPRTSPGPDGTWVSSSWVGLDGLSGGVPGGNSTDVLQAGVDQIVDSQGQTTYRAWFEWFVPPDQPDGSYSQNLINQFP